MRRCFLLYRLSLVFFAAALLQSCKKENGIDNNSVIKKPYSLYAGASNGALLNTNDGTDYRTIFPADNYPARAIVTYGMNVMFIKGNLHLSVNNGNFNPKYFLVNQLPNWQQMILNVQSHSRLYLSSGDPLTKGIVYSEDSGMTWQRDTAWDAGVEGGWVTSFTQLKNGVLFAYNDFKDSLYQRDSRTDAWTLAAPNRQQPSGTSYLCHFNNTLTLTDSSGATGVQYSNDSGKTWTAYNGLPPRKLYATAAPFEKVLLVGTDSMGVYRLENGQFVPSNNGLETNTSVYGIVGKDNIYKNDISKNYIYLATDKGIYRSEDLGFSWARMLEGSFRTVY